MNKDKLKNNLPYAVSTLVVYGLLLTAWELAIPLLHISPITLVPPSQIVPLIIRQHTAFLTALAFTFNEIWWGWLIGNALGIGAAVCLYRFRQLARFLVSLSVVVNAVPLVALSAIIAGFMGTAPASKIVITALICFFPMFISALTGFIRLDRNQEQLLRTYASSWSQEFFKLIVPNGLPYIMTALKLNVLGAIFAAITGEFFGSYGGIGQLILANRGLYNLGMVWGAIVYVVAAGTLFYFAVSVLQHKIVFWKQ